jgi:predicted phage terminase large subunit-like protein
MRKKLRAMSLEKRKSFIDSLSPAKQKELRFTAYYWLRDDQVLENEKGCIEARYIVCQCGRSWGKTYVGAAYVQLYVEHILPGSNGDICIVAPTHSDHHKVVMKAFREIYHPDDCPEYIENKGEIRFKNGTIVHTQSSDQPLRGGNFQFVWCDEMRAWCEEQEAKTADKFNTFTYGVRRGDCQFLITSSPSNGGVFKEWATRLAEGDPAIVMRRGTSYDNPVLGEKYFADIRRNEGTRKGRNEIFGELVTDNPNALWSHEDFELCRVDSAPDLTSIAIAVDPAVTSHEKSDATAITVGGLGYDGHSYLLKALAMKVTPDVYCRKAVELFHLYQADCIVVEVNNGGDTLRALIQTIDPNVPVKNVTATRNKITRAGPIANLYKTVESGNVKPRIHHVGAAKQFQELEEQCCSYVPDTRQKSPDLMDSLVWLMTHLFWSRSAPPSVNARWSPIF